MSGDREFFFSNFPRSAISDVKDRFIVRFGSTRSVPDMDCAFSSAMVEISGGGVPEGELTTLGDNLRSVVLWCAVDTRLDALPSSESELSSRLTVIRIFFAVSEYPILGPNSLSSSSLNSGVCGRSDCGGAVLRGDVSRDVLGRLVSVANDTVFLFWTGNGDLLSDYSSLSSTDVSARSKS